MSTMPRSRIAWGVFALCLALVACSAGSAATTASTGPLLPSTPDALPTMDPSTFNEMLSEQRGTPILVNVWASWCAPCKAETPDLIAAHERLGDRVRFIGVNAQDDRTSATEFIHDFEVPYPSVFDPSNAIAISYGLYSPPSTLFFDANGVLVKTVPGQISPDDLRAGLQAITSHEA
jgi:cytochrome c biogenesis protein CcmG/thiol:disulfide interchange protein DsbE